MAWNERREGASAKKQSAVSSQQRAREALCLFFFDEHSIDPSKGSPGFQTNPSNQPITQSIKTQPPRSSMHFDRLALHGVAAWRAPSVSGEGSPSLKKAAAAVSNRQPTGMPPQSKPHHACQATHPYPPNTHRDDARRRSGRSWRLAAPGPAPASSSSSCSAASLPLQTRPPEPPPARRSRRSRRRRGPSSSTSPLQGKQQPRPPPPRRAPPSLPRPRPLCGAITITSSGKASPFDLDLASRSSS